MKMEKTGCSETSAYKIQTPGNYPEERIQHSEQDESSKSCKYSANFFSETTSCTAVLLRTGLNNNATFNELIFVTADEMCSTVDHTKHQREHTTLGWTHFVTADETCSTVDHTKHQREHTTLGWTHFVTADEVCSTVDHT